MRNPILGFALAAPLMAVLSYGSTTLANEGDQQADGRQMMSCAASSDAVTTLPEPLNRWAQLRCTTAGYVITGREGWIWLEPTHKALVVIPSQSFGGAEGPDPNAYFTKIEVTKVTGDEFERAYEVFHAGFDPKDAKPSAYRLDVTTMDGNDIRLYMFDYFTYGWGMACSKDACDRSSRFVMLDMNKDPQPLAQPI
jgi:hypothetical protein